MIDRADPALDAGLVDIEDQPFNQALSVRRSDADNADGKTLSWPIEQELLAGHRYLLSFWLRAELPSDEATAAVWAQVRRVPAPHQPAVVARAPTSEQWRRIDVPFEPTFSLPPGFAELTLELDDGVDPLQIAALRLLDYGPTDRAPVLPEAAIAQVDTPTAVPTPRDPFGTIAIPHATVRLTQMALTGDPRTYLFAGHVQQTPNQAGSTWKVPLDPNEQGVVLLFDRRHAEAICQSTGVDSPAHLRGERLVVTGRIAWSPQFERPAIAIDTPAQVRLAELPGEVVDAANRRALIDAALFDKQIVARGKVVQHEHVADQGIVVLRFEGATAEGDLRLIVPANLFAPLTGKFGGHRGSGIEGRPVAFKATPQYDPLTDQLTATLDTTQHIDAPGTFTAPAVDGERALRFVVDRADDEKPWSVQLTQQPNVAIAKGTRVKLTARMRADRDGVKAEAVVGQASQNGDQHAGGAITLSREWKVYEFAGKFPRGYAPGDWQCTFHLGLTRRATIDIAEVRLTLDDTTVNVLANPGFAAGTDQWKITRSKQTSVDVIDAETALPRPQVKLSAVRLESKKSADPWQVGIKQKMERDVPVGRTITCRVLMRSTGGQARLLGAVGPEVRLQKLMSFTHPLSVGPKWAVYEFTAEADARYRSDRWSVGLMAGQQPQRVEIARFEVLVDGDDGPINDNPTLNDNRKHWETPAAGGSVNTVTLDEIQGTPPTISVPDPIDANDRKALQAIMNRDDDTLHIVRGTVSNRPAKNRDGQILISVNNYFLIVVPRKLVDAMERQYGVNAATLDRREIRVIGDIEAFGQRPMIQLHASGDLTVTEP